MPTPREQVTQRVDELVNEGVISRDMRDQYITLMAADDKVAGRFANELAGGKYFTQRAQQQAEAARQHEAKMQQERDALARQRAELENWRLNADQKVQLAETQLPVMTAKIAALEQHLRDYNLDPSQVHVPTITMPETPRPLAPQSTSTQPSGDYLSRDEGYGAMREFMVQQGKANKVQAQHQRLFGTYLEDDILTEALQANQDVEVYYRTKYNVSAREAQVQQQNREQEIARIREEERSKLMAEFTADPSRLIGSQGIPGSSTSMVHDQYMAKAAQHRNPIVDPAAPQTSPELRSPLQNDASRTAAAAKFFTQNYNLDGNPITDEGRKLANQHGYGTA